MQIRKRNQNQEVVTGMTAINGNIARENFWTTDGGTQSLHAQERLERGTQNLHAQEGLGHPNEA